MNHKIEILKNEILSDDWYTLRKITFNYTPPRGRTVTQSREAYDRGNGAVVLLYDPARQTVLLTRQFRMPTYINGNKNGLLIEACAGLLDRDAPEEAIRREIAEETGYSIVHVTKRFEAYMSPGSVTEILHFFTAEYDQTMRRSAGGGVPGEEEIEVMELSYAQAWSMVEDGRICDGKTILLLQWARLKGLLPL